MRWHFLTFSGAHGVGKSTLLADCADAYTALGLHVSTVPSCSSHQFAEWRVRNPGLNTYADIDRLGLRVAWQAALPITLNALLSRAVSALPACDSVLLVDRWHCDIDAYSAMEIQDPAQLSMLSAMAQSSCTFARNLVFAAADRAGAIVDEVHVVVPLACSNFLINQSKPNRGTCDRSIWERHLLGDIANYCQPEQVFHVDAQDRQERVGQILARSGRSALPGSGVPAAGQVASAH